MQADWIKRGTQEDDWTTVMMSVLSLRMWVSGSDVKNRLLAKQPGMSAGE